MKTPIVDPSKSSKPRSFPLPSLDEKYTVLLGGPPDSVSMRSGYVQLLPGESIGMHSTGSNEELLITLSGRGELCSLERDALLMNTGCVIYNPPHVSHNVVNTGDQPLRYIYIVAKA